jgi:hypothetical protein
MAPVIAAPARLNRQRTEDQRGAGIDAASI